MKKTLLLFFGAMRSVGRGAYHAQLYGSNCQGAPGVGCGINSDINVNSINCVLYDSNSSDPPIQCQTSLSGYSNLPSTVDPTRVWTWTTNHASDAIVAVGMQSSQTSFTVTYQFPAGSAGQSRNIGTSHKVVVCGLVPAGTGSQTPTYSLYLAVGMRRRRHHAP